MIRMMTVPGFGIRMQMAFQQQHSCISPGHENGMKKADSHTQSHINKSTQHACTIHVIQTQAHGQCCSGQLFRKSLPLAPELLWSEKPGAASHSLQIRRIECLRLALSPEC